MPPVRSRRLASQARARHKKFLWTLPVPRVNFGVTDKEFAINIPISRRRFVGACSAGIVGLLIPESDARLRAATPHPAPRPGITGKNVLTKEQLSKTPKLVPLFDSVREIPEVVDGIGCNCGCTDPPTLRSLLSCFEGKGMARDCYICQGQARLAVRLHKEGKSLDEIRTAIDAKFG